MPSSKNQNIEQNATTSRELNVFVDPDEIDDGPQNIYEKIYDIAGKAASTNLGQYAIEKVDRILTVVEKTAKWSLPQKEPATDKGISAPVLERPCSWIPFLSLIVALRVVRVGLSFGSILIGNRPVSPSNMVHFIQSRRRKLRAIKYHGLRAIRIKKQNQTDRKRYGVIGKLTSILNMVVCRPGFTSEPETQIIVKKTTQKSKKFKTSNENHITSYRESLNSNDITSQKRPLEKDDDDISDTDGDLPVDKLLDKYGDDASDIEDPDFVPEIKSDDSLSTDSELSDNDELRQKLNELKRKQEEIIKNIHKNSNEEATISSLEGNNDFQNENKNQEELNTENLVDANTIEKTTSATVNPTRMSPKIAQNGTVEDEKYENFYDTLECGSDDTEQKKGGSSNFSDNIKNNIKTVNENLNVKKIIEIRENSLMQEEKRITTTDNTTNNENLKENHVQTNQQQQQQQQQEPHSYNQHHHHHQQHNTNYNQTKQHNNKKFYNNNSNHSTTTSTSATYKYSKGRKIH